MSSCSVEVKATAIDRYDAYKDSGVEWLGEIPEHWKILPINAISKLRSSVNHKKLELLSVYLDKGVIKFSDIEEKRTNVTSEDRSKYQLVLPGDFVLNNQQAWRGSVGVSKHRGIVSPAYLVLELSDLLNSQYANYLFRDSTMVAQYLISSRGVGTIQRNLYWQQFKRSVIYFPPIAEQKIMAEFLDDKTQKIDRAIAIKQKQIELLKERRQILIHNAVTRGLDPNKEMKDSGVEWIGDVPKHWEVKRLKHVTLKIGSGVTPSGGGNTYLNFGIPLLRSQNVHFGKIDLDGVAYISERTNAEMANSQVRCDDVLLNITGGSIGRCHYVDSHSQMNVNQHVCIVRPNTNILSIFLNSVLASNIGQDQIWYYQQGGGREGLNFQNLKNFFITLPPKDEQISISVFIIQMVEKFENAHQIMEKEIEKLKEYKASLVNSVVTGKVKVV